MNSLLKGTLDEARAYSRVLSAGEIKLMYDARSSCTGSSCGGCPTGMTLVQRRLHEHARRQQQLQWLRDGLRRCTNLRLRHMHVRMGSG